MRIFNYCSNLPKKRKSSQTNEATMLKAKTTNIVAVIPTATLNIVSCFSIKVILAYN